MTDYTGEVGSGVSRPGNVVPGYLEGAVPAPPSIAPYSFLVVTPLYNGNWANCLSSAMDYARYLQQTTWNISQQYGRQSDTAQFTLVDYAANGQFNCVIMPNSIVVFIDNRTGDVLYGGVCDDPQFTYQSPVLSYWVLNCTGFQNYLPKAFPAGLSVEFGEYVIGPDMETTGDIGEMVVKMITDYGATPPATYDSFFGVTAALTTSGGYVNTVAGVDSTVPQVPLYTAENKDIQTILTELAQLASGLTSASVGTWGYYVDELRQLHFNPQTVQQDVPVYNPVTHEFTTQAPVPVTITDSAILQGTVNIGHMINDTTFGYDWNGADLRNVAHLQGTSVDYVQMDTWLSDGITSQWTLSFVPDFSQSQNPASTVPPVLTLTIGGTPYTVGQNQGGAAAFDFSITESADGTWVLQLGTEATPLANLAIILTYNYLAAYTTTVMADYRLPANSNPNPNPYNGPNQGQYAEFVTESSMTSLTSIEAQGDREIGEYGFAQETLTFNTTQDFTGHIRAGQIITGAFSQLPDSQNNYQRGLYDQFIVTQCNITPANEGAGFRQYGITAIRTFVSDLTRTSAGGQRAYTFQDLIAQLNNDSAPSGTQGAQSVTQLLVDFEELFIFTDIDTVTAQLNPAWDAGEWGLVFAE